MVLEQVYRIRRNKAITMYDNDNYPAGADTPSAPWNDTPVPVRVFNVCISQSISKTTTVFTDNYIPQPDEEMGCTFADTSDTNWLDEYHDNDHYTPAQLIVLFKMCLEDLQATGVTWKSPDYMEHLIEECGDWEEDETEIVEDAI